MAFAESYDPSWQDIARRASFLTLVDYCSISFWIRSSDSLVLTSQYFIYAVYHILPRESTRYGLFPIMGQ